MADIQTGKFYSLGKKTFWLFILERSALTIIILVSVFLLNYAYRLIGVHFSTINQFSILFQEIKFIAMILAIVLELVGIIIALLQYSVSKVMLDDSSLRIIRGILSKEEVAIPFRRIQSVQIKQPFIYRILGVGRVVISSTTDLDQPSPKDEENDDQVVPLMDYDLSRMVANALTSKAEVERMQVQRPNFRQ